MGDFLKTGSSEGKKIGSLEGKPFTLKSLSSNPPTLLSSDKPLSLTLSPKGQEDKKEFPSLEGRGWVIMQSQDDKISPHPCPLPWERELVGWDKRKRSHLVFYINSNF